MISVFILALSILIASALCSLAEAALLSLPLIRARVLYEEKRKNSKELLYLKENLPIVIAFIVIANNSINIIGSIYVGEQVTLRFGHEWLGVVSAVFTFFIILFSEIIPKTIGERYKVFISLSIAKPLRILLWVFRPLVELFIRITRLSLEKYKKPRVSEDEIKMMLKLGRDAGTVELDEEVLCSRVFKLNDVYAEQIMKPLDQMYVLPANKTLEEVKDDIVNSHFSRMGVYGNHPRDIVGIVQQSILLQHLAKNDSKAYVKDFMTQPITVAWSTKADALLEKFQAYQQHLFIVQDSNKKNVGIVSMEDVLEELFGEIYDEKDVRKSKLKKNDPKEKI